MKNTGKLCITLLLALLVRTGLSQNYISLQKTQINQIQKIQSGPSDYAVNAFINIYKDHKKEQRAREEAQAKLTLLKENYKSYSTYPDSITSGWHNVIVTDNLKFCRDAKAFVRGNRIENFVIENCFPLNFTASGKIKNGRNVLTLNKFNGEQLEIVDVYFLYDLDEPQLTTPPIDPGYITFWTPKKSFVGNKIIVDDVAYDGVTQTFKKNPECNQAGTTTLALKPGTYTFRALKTGNDLDGSFEIKSGQCLLYVLF